MSACSRQGLRIRLGKPTFLSGWISHPQKGHPLRVPYCFAMYENPLSLLNL